MDRLADVLADKFRLTPLCADALARRCPGLTSGVCGTSFMFDFMRKHNMPLPPHERRLGREDPRCLAPLGPLRLSRAHPTARPLYSDPDPEPESDSEYPPFNSASPAPVTPAPPPPPVRSAALLTEASACPPGGTNSEGVERIEERREK
eukprot:121362-Rhodomonas_salina.1